MRYINPRFTLHYMEAMAGMTIHSQRWGRQLKAAQCAARVCVWVCVAATDIATVHLMCLWLALHCIFIVPNLNCLVSLDARSNASNAQQSLRDPGSTWHPCSKVIAGLMLRCNGWVFTANTAVWHSALMTFPGALYLSIMVCHSLKRPQADPLYLSENIIS